MACAVECISVTTADHACIRVAVANEASPGLHVIREITVPVSCGSELDLLVVGRDKLYEDGTQGSWSLVTFGGEVFLR